MLKVAIIGYGGMGKWHSNHWQYAEKNGKIGVSLKGVYDIMEEKRAKAREAGLFVYDSLEDVFADQEISGVLIATPNDTHLPICVAAANAKKHVLCEKPLACNFQDARTMYEICEQNGVTLSVHQNRRFDPDYLTVRKIVESGVIGEVYRIESTVAGSNGIPGAWRKEKKRGGGMMLDWGVHLIDQMRVFYGEPKGVSTRLSYVFKEEVDDGFDCVLSYDNVEIRINVDTNCFVPRPRWTVFGKEGTARIDDWDLNGEIVRVKTRNDEQLQGVNAGNGMTKTMARRRDETVEKLPLPIERGDSFAYYKNFEELLDGKGEPLAKKEEVLSVMAIMEKAVYSV
jgi:predicted dehydrogenase